MESIEEIEHRHEQELQELSERIKEMMKGVKKSNRAQVEAQAVQLQFDLKARHREELETAEENGAPLHAPLEMKVSATEVSVTNEEDKVANQKKAKAKKKQDRKNQKEREREEKKQEILGSLVGVESSRDREMNTLKEILDRENLQVRDIPSDGNCLYRAIADQLSIIHELSTHAHKKQNGKSESNPHVMFDFKQLRRIAADHMRKNAEEFAPFLGFAPDDEAFEEYCRKVSSDTLAEWGGQLEIRALSESLKHAIYVYSANAPVLKMGEEYLHEKQENHNASSTPIRLSYHRHLFALGEHYNSLVPRCC